MNKKKIKELWKYYLLGLVAGLVVFGAILLMKCVEVY